MVRGLGSSSERGSQTMPQSGAMAEPCSAVLERGEGAGE